MNSQLSSLNSSPSIELHIEELVLHGFAPGERYVIGDAVERELARLLTERPLPAVLEKNISLDRIDGGAFRMADNSKPATIGEQIAGAVCGGFSR